MMDYLGIIVNLILLVIVFGFLFFAIRATWRDWRNQESQVKRYGCE